ncbi:hypothetical protein HID58_000562 [Brassica napus]|uniref:Aspartate aminotransferase n=2 Tax=Brassica TaxID=3705 RepID=A0ABQ8EH13_BRANA|nr:hypothetical protein HID58_000562 [Brassica napus]
MIKILHLLLKVSVVQFLCCVYASTAFHPPASQPSLSPVYTSMASFSPGIQMSRGQVHNKLIIALIISSSSLGLIVFCCLCFWAVYRSKQFPKPTKNSESGISLPKKGFVQSFDYKTLEKATCGFKDSNLIGRGGFGFVYKACLDNHTLAAVKKIENVSQEAKREFQNEVDLLSKIHHPNIISLLGHTSEISSSFIVYELMEKGSLDAQLHGPSRGSALTWHMRMKIALDTARGVEYLHERCRPPVIHRDIKSSNILLDSSFNAKISDFGLAVTNGMHGKNNIKLSGTLGYVAPEYLLDGKLTDKSDVYSFGVVLLELLLGRRPVEKLSSVQCQSLVTWAMPQLTDRSKLPKIVDPVIKDTMDHKHLYQVAAVAVLCVQPEPSYRPLITDVLHSLVPLVPVELGGTLRLVIDSMASSMLSLGSTSLLPRVINKDKLKLGTSGSNPFLKAKSFSRVTMSVTVKPSRFEGITMAPPDPILGVSEAFKADTNELKLNLGVGAYRTEELQPYVLNVVKKAENLMLERGDNKEYLPIEGLAAFNKATAELLFGAGHPVIKEQKVATIQGLSGTGSLRLAAALIERYFPGAKVLISAPTWGNHKNIFNDAKVPWSEYRYYDPKTIGLDFEGMIADIKEAPEGSFILLHGCAHNPTGIDPTPEQWVKIADVIQEKNHIPFFDVAYQGFASGSLDEDAASVRLFAERGMEFFVAQSYSKNLGLYAERIGAINVVCSSADAATRVKSQLKRIARPMYSNPPVHGARIVANVVGDAAMFNEWKAEMEMMAGRIKTVRQQLYDSLVSKDKSGKDWSFILKQIGMFSFTGLNKAQSDNMTDKWHVYMTKDGRISLAGLSMAKCEYLADAIIDSYHNALLYWETPIEL